MQPFNFLVVLLPLLLSSELYAAVTLKFWQRPKGAYEMVPNPDKANEKTLTIEQSKVEKIKIADLQYAKEYFYKAINLGPIIAAERPNAKMNLALLHFDNGMIVPLPAEKWQGGKNQDDNIYLAVAMRKVGEPKWRHNFNPVPRPDKQFRDPSPIKFLGNKIVVTKGFSLPNSPSKKSGFSPFLYTSSLLGIEWVNEDAYSLQFKPKGAKLSGLNIFARRCWYCHGIKRIGARFGWDFVVPLPIYQKRSVASLFAHVKTKKQDAIQMGMHMPNQADFTEKEAEELWAYLKTVTKAKMRSYNP